MKKNIELTDLQAGILKVLYNWDGWWYTYESLRDALYDEYFIEYEDVPVKKLKVEMKNLQKLGFVYLSHIFDEDGYLAGSGWIISGTGRSRAGMI